MDAAHGPWLEVSWRLATRSSRKKRGKPGTAGSLARRPRGTEMDLAQEAVAMMDRTALEHAISEWATSSGRGRDGSIILQLILSELRRVHGEAFISDEESCLVRKAELPNHRC